MAEGPEASPFGGRQFIIITTVVTVIVFIFMLVGLRSCSTGSGGDQYTVIYSNLDLKDTAEIIARLKEINIQYRIKDKGRSVAVPKEKADDARLGLAEKNLPMGGVVGWEIFDQTKLGATDFDRRIQFIRAVSGELSRAINRIRSVEDSRVQIVIPETKLFEAAKAPVTASVLLKLQKGEQITSKHINGIVHLVASSVENLKRENVTIIDTDGNILSGGGYTMAPPVTESPKTTKAEVRKAPAKEKILIEVKAKKTLEDQLTSKAQSLINKMYPPNTVIIRVGVDSLDNQRATAIVLLDEKLEIGRDLKKNTFETIAVAIGYDKKRGDKIIMKRVPFREAGLAVIGKKPAKPKKAAPKTVKTPKKRAGINISGIIDKGVGFVRSLAKKYGAWRVAIGSVLSFLFFVFFVIPFFRKGKKEVKTAKTAAAGKTEATSQLDKIRNLAETDPEAVAKMLTAWVREEAG
ncbi:flagellar basal-body MS-ring/collar protein FliF [Candidatus Margulisiibacteriota bacterium]